MADPVQNTTFDRTDLLPHWAPSLQCDERAAKLAAWQAHRACADCRWWEQDADTPQDRMGVCGAPSWDRVAGCLTAPADHTCEEWEAAFD